MTRFFLAAGLLTAGVVACAALTRREHGVREASFLLGDLRLHEQPRFLDDTKEEGKEGVREKGEEAEVKEVEAEKDMEVEVKEGEVEWKEEELLGVDVSSLGASMASLRRFLHHARTLRKRRARRDKREVEAGALSLHRLNLHLRDAGSPPRPPHPPPHQVATLDEAEGSAPLTVVESSGRSVGLGGDCGGSQALGVFNFLTFMVYALSLVMTVIGLAQGTMADTFLGQVINTIIPNKRSFSAAAPGMPHVVPEVTELLGLVQRVLRGTARHPRDTRRQQEQEQLEAVRKELSVGMVTALLEVVRNPEELWSQESRVQECSSPVTVWARRYFTTHAHTFLASHA